MCFLECKWNHSMLHFSSDKHCGGFHGAYFNLKDWCLCNLLKLDLFNYVNLLNFYLFYWKTFQNVRNHLLKTHHLRSSIHYPQLSFSIFCYFPKGWKIPLPRHDFWGLSLSPSETLNHGGRPSANALRQAPSLPRWRSWHALMGRAWAHYIHVVCTSGHPLWQCSEQPIIYSTLISTHVNPHQSSTLGVPVVAAIQQAGRTHEPSTRRHFWARYELAITPGRLPQNGL